LIFWIIIRKSSRWC